MRLPNGRQARVDESKLRDYLLSRVHPIGRFKAAFFAGLGYSERDADELGGALRGVAEEGAVEMEEANDYGRKYRVRGVLTGPRGRSADS